MNFSFGCILIVSHYTKSLTDTVIIIVYGFCILYLRIHRELIPVPSQCYPYDIMCVQYETGASLVVQIVKSLQAIQETQVQSLGQEDPLEKEMATHSSTLAWRIPWTEEAGQLQLMGLQRFRHDWVTNTSNMKL